MMEGLDENAKRSLISEKTKKARKKEGRERRKRSIPSISYQVDNDDDDKEGDKEDGL